MVKVPLPKGRGVGKPLEWFETFQADPTYVDLPSPLEKMYLQNNSEVFFKPARHHFNIF